MASTKDYRLLCLENPLLGECAQLFCNAIELRVLIVPVPIPSTALLSRKLSVSENRPR
jgi:hypothetical protein